MYYLLVMYIYVRRMHLYSVLKCSYYYYCYYYYILFNVGSKYNDRVVIIIIIIIIIIIFYLSVLFCAYDIMATGSRQAVS